MRATALCVGEDAQAHLDSMVKRSDGLVCGGVLAATRYR